MADLIRPHIQDFARDDLPSLKMVRSMPSEYRGVFENLRDALKETRSCVFRRGDTVLTDAEVAQLSSLKLDVLVRVLPHLMVRSMMARDDDGALFSPHMFDSVLRKEERQARKAGQSSLTASPAPPTRTMPPCRLVWKNGAAE